MSHVVQGMRLLAVLAVLGLVLAACGSSSDGGGTAAQSIVASARKAKVGTVIVDAQGRTLYRFTAEAQGRPCAPARA